MRTTLTLDDDVTALLEKEIKKTGLSFKAAVNHFLRLGMVQAKQQTARKRFVVEPFSLHLPSGLSYDKISTLLEELEGPEHR